MQTKKILFTNADKSVIRTQVELPLEGPWSKGGWVPEFLVYDGKLYQQKGMGMTAWFYHEVRSFFHATTGTHLSSIEFSALD